VRQIKRDFPHLTIILNGGIKTLVDIDAELPHVDGMMIGRAAYTNPWFLAEIQNKYLSGEPAESRSEIIQQFLPYVREQVSRGIRLTSITRHILGLFQGQRGAANWRRYLSQHARRDVGVIQEALELVVNR
jgi:tRNA-dihydrouridine synthase A